MEVASRSVDRVLLLGPLQVIQNRAQLRLPPSRKVRARLAYLAMATRPVNCVKLCELFWDVANDLRGELRWCLSKLRPLVDAPTTTRLIANREQVRIDTNSLNIDSISLERSAQITLTSGSPEDLQSLRALFRAAFSRASPSKGASGVPFGRKNDNKAPHLFDDALEPPLGIFD
jgi:DNA-binding SARP family transcriptional activator